jgi:hypothetical protein
MNGTPVREVLNGVRVNCSAIHSDPDSPVRKLAAFAFALCLCATCSYAADPLSDAPEDRQQPPHEVRDFPSYAQAVQAWRTPEDLNAWIAAKFEYDVERSMLLSETQRAAKPGPPIHLPEAFFAAPKGICVDLSRFAVETLRVVAPELKARYVMIEFNPVAIRGNTLRRHWVASFERGGQRYFFADSKRPGHMAGPYASTQAYLDDYAKYRGREIVAFRETDSFMRRAKTPAAKPRREADG